MIEFVTLLVLRCGLDLITTGTHGVILAKAKVGPHTHDDILIFKYDGFAKAKVPPPSPVSELGLALFQKRGHTFLLVFGCKHRMEHPPLK